MPCVLLEFSALSYLQDRSSEQSCALDSTTPSDLSTLESLCTAARARCTRAFCTFLRHTRVRLVVLLYKKLSFANPSRFCRTETVSTFSSLLLDTNVQFLDSTISQRPSSPPIPKTLIFFPSDLPTNSLASLCGLLLPSSLV